MRLTKHNTEIDVIETSLNKDFWTNHFSYWENSTFDFLFQHLDKNKVFIDIGAWIGPISLIACQHSKACISFEPDPIAYVEFVQNIKLNNFTNILAEPVAVSPYDVIFIGSKVLGHSETRESCKLNSIECKCVSLSNLLYQYNLTENKISVLKMDIEGHESEVLQDISLWDLNIPMHISLHPGWAEDKNIYYSKILPFLIHKRVDITNIEKRGNFFDIRVLPT